MKTITIGELLKHNEVERLEIMKDIVRGRIKIIK